uniref:Uncharacterized protein n=1 Tax=candidate division CPR3 bacterium TaxID=2268181 RepID=A0A7C4M266_UNCC3
MTNKLENLGIGLEEQGKIKSTILMSKIFTIQKEFDSGRLEEDDYRDFKNNSREVMKAYCVVDSDGTIRIKTGLRYGEVVDAIKRIDGLNKLADSILSREKRKRFEEMAG